MMQSHSIQANGLTHRVLEWPSNKSVYDTVFLIHGFQDSAATWSDVAIELASAGYRVLAPDLRGFGDTDRIGKGGYYHFFDYIFDVADLVDHFCPSQPIVLVGHSMGGVIASLYTGTFLERIKTLVLLEGLGPEHIPVEQSPERVRVWIEGVRDIRTRDKESTFTLEEAARRLGRNHPNLKKDALVQRALELTRPLLRLQQNESKHEQDLERTWKFDPLHRTNSPLGFSKERWKAHVACIKIPTLFVHGGISGMRVSDEEERIRSFPNIQSIGLDGAGHMMHWTQPRRLAKILVDWFVGVILNESE